jgi:DNA polymerase-3 subunit chi
VEITFYVLPPDAPLSARASTVCRLVDKALKQKRQVLIVAGSKGEAEALDEALWTFSAESFIPHHLVGDGPTPPPPVRLTWQAAPAECRDILVNLSADLPEGFQRFNRVIEVVAGSDAEREQAREHWKAYKRQGYRVDAHELAV